MESIDLSNINRMYQNGEYQKVYDIVNTNLKEKKVKKYTYHKALCEINKKLKSKLAGSASEQEETKMFSVITVNFNNLSGLKKTITSVLSQTAVNKIQFIVMDGGSDDGSVEYLKTVAEDIDIAISGRDEGIYDAMNRGIEFAESKYCVFMNSGDCFDDDTVIQRVISEIDDLDCIPDVIYGHTRWENGKVWKALDLNDFWKGMKFSHQSVFIDTKSLKAAPYDKNLKVVADFVQLYKMMLDNCNFHKVDMVIGHVEEFNSSLDFTSRTVERWMAVREINNPNVSKDEIDAFYTTFLASKDNPWTSSHFFETNQAQAKLISNVEERVVFLISMPRSGSTLLQRILEQSDQLNTLGEPWLMLPLLSGYDEELVEAKYGQKLNVLAKDDFLVNSSNPNVIKDAQRVYADSVYSSIIRESDKRYFLDKTPRYIYIVNKLKEIYPKAKFIVLLRNPAAIVSSYAHTWFSDSFEKLSNDKYCRYDFEQGFGRLSEFLKSDFKNKHIVRYEDLVSTPEKVLPKLFGYLGLPFDKQYINYKQKEASLKKFRFGDPTTVYEKDRPDESHAVKWLKDIEKNGTHQEFLDVLDLVPDQVVQSLGYDKIEIKKQLGFDVLAFTFKKIEDEFGSNDEKLRIIRSKYNTLTEKTLGVLITSYNNEETIIDAINSVVKQSKKPDLIAIADDNSQDSSIDIIQKFIVEHPQFNIKLFLNETNLGVSKNRDLTIRRMDCDYITTLDGDDLFCPGKLEAEYLIMQNSEEKVAYSNILVQTTDKSILQDTSFYSGKTSKEMVRSLITRSSPVPRDMMFPKSLYLKADGFDHAMKAYEDWALKCRMMALSNDNSWVSTGLIGTVYDRRYPGLSNLDPIVHVSNQLLALARNYRYLYEDNSSLAESIVMLSKLVNGKTSELMIEFSENLIKGGVNNVVEKKFDIYKKDVWGKQLTNQDLFQYVWKLVKI